MNPKHRINLAWCLLITSLIGWPASALTIAKDEPFVVLSLSWFAITLTSLDVLFTADVRKHTDSDKDEG